jgi:hypothetical protein
MDSFQEALSRYQNDAGSLARGALQGNEAGLRAQASMVSMKESALSARAGFDFTKKITGERDETQAGSEIGQGGMIGAPAILKAGSALAAWRSSSLTTKWKGVNASRQRAKTGGNEEGPDQNVEQDFNEGEHPGMETPQAGGDATRTGKIGNIEVSRGEQRSPIDDNDFDEDAPEVGDTPSVQEPEDLNLGTGKPRQVMNESSQAEPQASQPKPQVTQAEEYPEGGGGADFYKSVPTEATQAEGQATQAESQATSEASQAESQATSEADTAGAEAEADVQDLAPEITAASSAWGTAAGVLGGALGLAGGAFGIYAMIEGVKGAIDASKEMSEDPYAAIRGKIASAQGKISAIQSEVGGDQFTSKLGAGVPSFGSMAVPTFDTSKIGSMMGSHF